MFYFQFNWIIFFQIRILCTNIRFLIEFDYGFVFFFPAGRWWIFKWCDSKIDRIPRKPKRPYILCVVCSSSRSVITNTKLHSLFIPMAMVLRFRQHIVFFNLQIVAYIFGCVCVCLLGKFVLFVFKSIVFFSASFESFIFHFSMGLCNIYLETKAMLMVVVNAFESILFHTYYIWIFYIWITMFWDNNFFLMTPQ